MTRIALISDTHTTREGKDGPLYIQRFERVITDVNAAHVHAVFFAGDLTENGTTDEAVDFMQLARGLDAPMWFVPGNHDVGGKIIPGKPGGVTMDRVEWYEATVGASFFTDVFKGIRLIGLTSSLLGSGLPRDREQWEFLERELAKPSPLPTLLILHNPPFLADPHEPGGDYWNIEPEPRARLLALLLSGSVRAVLSGHIHRSLATWHGGVLYVTTPPVSYGIPGDQPQGWTLLRITEGGEVEVETRTIPD